MYFRKRNTDVQMETKEKILLNIEKINKRINPNSKKSIVVLDEDPQFKSLIDSVEGYVEAYNNGEEFPADVYKAIYSLIEYATEQFNNDEGKIDELSCKMEENIKLAGIIQGVLNAIEEKQDWRKIIDDNAGQIPEDIRIKLMTLGREEDLEAEQAIELKKEIEANISNLQSNLHIEIDLERLNDRIKALSYIGVEISEAFKRIKNVEKVEEAVEDDEQYLQDTTFEIKPNLWQRIKNSSFVRAVRYIFSLKVTLQSALPEGKGENK